MGLGTGRGMGMAMGRGEGPVFESGLNKCCTTRGVGLKRPRADAKGSP